MDQVEHITVAKSATKKKKPNSKQLTQTLFMNNYQILAQQS